MGNWEQKLAGDEVIRVGKNAIIGRNGAILEISINGTNWETIHTFPPAEGEFFIIDLPTATYLRLTGGGAWAISLYNEMSG